MRRAARILWLAAVLALLPAAMAGCGTKSLCATDPGTTADVAAPDVPGADADDGAPPGDGVQADVPVEATGDDVAHDTVQPASYVPARSFRFRGAGREGQAFKVEVVARDFDAVFGLALRVEWDPASLALVSATPQAIFGAEADGAGVYRAAEVRPGSLALGLAHLYYLANEPLEGDVVVATLLLEPLDGRPADLAFFAPRCLVLDGDRSPIEASYLPAILNP